MWTVKIAAGEPGGWVGAGLRHCLETMRGSERVTDGPPAGAASCRMQETSGRGQTGSGAEQRDVTLSPVFGFAIQKTKTIK